MKYPEALLSTLEAIYRLACRTCAEIEKFRPEIVIGLAHSGWMPVEVARVLWAEQQSEPFPATVRTNLGQEKHEIYHARFGKAPPAFCCGECCWGENRLGHYLAWISTQDLWLAQLRAQVAAAYPAGEPEKVLVVDDLFGGFRTCYLAMNLLETLYPRVKCYTIAGQTDLTDQFVTAWLLTFLPAQSETILAEAAHSGNDRYATDWHRLLKPLITGSEDLAPDELTWQPLNVHSPAVKALLEYLPPAQILAAPAWALELACNYALQRLRGKISDQEAHEPAEDDVHLFPASQMEISNLERLARQAWLENGATKADIMQIFGEMPGTAAQKPNPLHSYEWQRHRHGQAVLYFPMPAFEAWMTAYDQNKSSESNLRPRCFEAFLPDQLWAGAYPLASDSRQQQAVFKELLGLGVNVFIDLTVAHEWHGRYGYDMPLNEVSQDLGLNVDHRHIPLPFRAAPTRQQMTGLLEIIETALASGQKLYLHAGHNLEGRVPMLLCCLLISRGWQPARALAQVDDFWLKTLPYLIRLPLTEAQKRFVLRWG